LYYYSLLLVSDLAKHAEARQRRIDNKYLVEENTLINNKNFINNQFIDQVRRNGQFQSYTNNNGVAWNNVDEYVKYFHADTITKKNENQIFIEYENFIKSIYNKLVATPEYQKYSGIENPAYNDDKNIVLYILENLVLTNELYYDLLEEFNIAWGDDLTPIFKTLLILVKKTRPLDLVLPVMYKDKAEDTGFARKLLHLPIINKDKYNEIISKHTKNWDLSRIQETDAILMRMAIAEFLEIPGIHANISLNEYIDISKFYNDPKTSPKFINGILNSILQELIKENKISKLKININKK
jgi:N utilization substance protein B